LPPFENEEAPPDSEIDAEEEGEDLMDDRLLARDYRANEALDRYEDIGLDEEEYDTMDPEARRAAEIALDRRDRDRIRRSARVPAALYSSEGDEAGEEAGCVHDHDRVCLCLVADCSCDG
jgi:hypothetical protein